MRTRDDGEDRDERATRPTNVVRLPRDWLGSRDELVPLQPPAPPCTEEQGVHEADVFEFPGPSTPSHDDFWGGALDAMPEPVLVTANETASSGEALDDDDASSDTEPAPRDVSVPAVPEGAPWDVSAPAAPEGAPRDVSAAAAPEGAPRDVSAPAVPEGAPRDVSASAGEDSRAGDGRAAALPKYAETDPAMLVPLLGVMAGSGASVEPPPVRGDSAHRSEVRWWPRVLTVAAASVLAVGSANLLGGRGARGPAADRAHRSSAVATLAVTAPPVLPAVGGLSRPDGSASGLLRAARRRARAAHRPTAHHRGLASRPASSAVSVAVVHATAPVPQTYTPPASASSDGSPSAARGSSSAVSRTYSSTTSSATAVSTPSYRSTQTQSGTRTSSPAPQKAGPVGPGAAFAPGQLEG